MISISAVVCNKFLCSCWTLCSLLVKEKKFTTLMNYMTTNFKVQRFYLQLNMALPLAFAHSCSVGKGREPS